jgi:GT2 family glycosyltransferase
MPKASVVILNWNSLEFVKSFLPVLHRYTPAESAEIVIIDNGSNDGSPGWIRQNYNDIRIIQLDRNYGYSGGYALGLKEIHSDFAVLINSDIEVTEGWIDGMLGFMETHPEAGALAPKILSYDNRDHFEYAGAAGGWIDRYGFPFCRGRIFNSIEKDSGQYDEPAKVFWASGACLMVRMESYRRAGGLDPHFFAHMEEIDLCWRLQLSGYGIWYYSGSIVFHVGGGTLPNESPYKLYLNFRNNLLLLFKNLGPAERSRILFIRMIFDGIAAFQYLLKGKFSNFGAVLRAHRDFKKMKRSEYKDYEFTTLADAKTLHGLYRGSIVIGFFIRGFRVFRQVPFQR